MQCFRCGTEVPSDSRYCPSCGASVSQGDADSATLVIDTRGVPLIEMLREAVGADFELHEELGRGGMAAVYLATERTLHRRVAIKVLPPELTFGRGAERFVREARTAAALEHPNIVPIYRVASSGTLFWYAMKFVEGQSLEALVHENGAMEFDRAVAILQQVAAALDYAHSRDVIHRDVKPANVMIEPGDRVLVTDFGIAKALREGTLTESGAIIGTPYYMSPEQGLGGELTGKSDQYAVAVMAFQMLTGKVPFDAGTPVAILHKHITDAPPSLNALRGGLPRQAEDAIRRGLAKHPEERFETVGAFVEALAGRRSVGKLPARPASGRRRAWVAAGVGVAALGAAAVVVTQRETAAGSAGRTDTTAIAAALPTSATGYLRLSGVPSGGTVLVDGRAVAGPVVPLEAGVHEVRVIAEGFAAVRESVRVAAGESLPWRFRGQALARAGETGVVGGTPGPLPADSPPRGRETAGGLPPGSGILLVQLSGGWGRIFVDGQFRAQDTRLRDTLPAGTHTLRLERQGYVTVDTSVTVGAGGTTAVRVPMRPVGEP